MSALPPTMRVLERGWLSSNNVLFLGRDQTALVDSGYLTHAVQTVALVAHGLQGRPLDRLLNTHLHSDHCGGNAALQHAYRCRTSIPASEAEAVRSWDQDALTFSGTGQQCARFSFDDTLQHGDLVMLGDLQWQVLAAAGHDPHSLVFYCAEERILISADALWENGFGVIFPELDGSSGFAEARATLELIAGLDVQMVIPGHGSPFSGAGAALETAFARLDYLAADPLRNAHNAIKVLLKFLLLERQQLKLDELPQMLSALPLVAAANRRFLQLSDAALAEWTAAQLVRAGAAEIRDGFLLNR
ncbi:MBL fold metallo-hydrolase [Collimonas sp. NPDC087041]|uniref:MBL fold metallo-hydrolase n=1 Tax=Collimonas sp. NPDC087041 TaxID=3363960 RepID=UPI00381B51BC